MPAVWSSLDGTINFFQQTPDKQEASNPTSALQGGLHLITTVV
jgi:hypothetical protein